MQVLSLHWEDLEKEMATHSSVLAWEILWTEEPHGLQFSPRGHKRVGHDLVTKQQQALRSTSVQGTLLGFGDTKVNTLAEFLLLRSIPSGRGKQTMSM